MAQTSAVAAPPGEGGGDGGKLHRGGKQQRHGQRQISPGIDAEQAGRGQPVAGDGLQQHPGHAQRGPGEQPGGHARQAHVADNDMADVLGIGGNQGLDHIAQANARLPQRGIEQHRHGQDGKTGHRPQPPMA